MYASYSYLNIHVLASDRELIKAIRKSFRKDVRRKRTFRERRHAYYREMLSYHHKEQAMVKEFNLL